MPALYTYPEHEGRARFSPAMWLGEHGERTVDLAWERANAQHAPDDHGDTLWWLDHSTTFPDWCRGDLQELYTEALQRMRAYLAR